MQEALTGKTVAQIRELARRDAASVLVRHWAPDVFPVEPVAIARSLGMQVFSAELGDDVFGMLVGGEGGAEIYLDRDQPPVRFRFSCAHEIGHYFLRKDDLTPENAFVDKRSDRDRGLSDEVYANEFAGSLLMPEGAIRAALAAGEDNYDLSRRFNVSMVAVGYRRNLLGI